MATLEELQKRKEQLLLEQEIAKLERNQKWAAAGRWKWLWVAPLSLFSLFIIISGIDQHLAAPCVLGLVGLVPLALRIYFGRAS